MTHAGYKDPNNLKFENITILGVSQHPGSVNVTHVTNKEVTSTLPSDNINYNGIKKVMTNPKMYIR